MPEPLNQLPYFREYVDQILRPRVGAIVEEMRGHLTDQVWGALLERMAQEQKLGADAQAVERLRVLLSEALGLRLNVQLSAEFGAGPASPGTPSGAEVVERTFPNNPLARAVSGVRNAGR